VIVLEQVAVPETAAAVVGAAVKPYPGAVTVMAPATPDAIAIVATGVLAPPSLKVVREQLPVPLKVPPLT